MWENAAQMQMKRPCRIWLNESPESLKSAWYSNSMSWDIVYYILRYLRSYQSICRYDAFLSNRHKSLGFCHLRPSWMSRICIGEDDILMYDWMLMILRIIVLARNMGMLNSITRLLSIWCRNPMEFVPHSALPQLLFFLLFQLYPSVFNQTERQDNILPCYWYTFMGLML